jgi:hypothetical protein
MLDVFGDESAGEEYASYAIVCVQSDMAATFGAKIAALKAEHGLEALHCRVLFSPDRRRKQGVERFTTPRVIEIYEDLADRIMSPDIRIVTARTRIADFAGVQPAEPPFPRLVFDKKTIGVLCANAALIPVLRDYRDGKVRFWPDHDPTKAEYLGKMMQASSAMGGYYNLDTVRDQRVSPTPRSEMPDDGRSTLFEFADLAAWLSNRVVSHRDSNLHGRLSELYRRLKPMEVRGVRWSDGGLSFNVPNEWPAGQLLGPLNTP